MTDKDTKGPYRNSANPNSLRERRRYQLAKEILLSYYSKGAYIDRADVAVALADALLDALEKAR